MIVNILISTIDQGIERVKSILQPKSPNVKYIISHQFRDEEQKTIPKALIRGDIIVSQIPGKGLSRNRNNALKLADGDIALIADDDVTYLPDSFQNILEVFKNDPELDVACFKVMKPLGEGDYKNYPKKSYKLRKYNRHSISSIEIAFRIDQVKKHGIRFDERFGLGSDSIPAGEEAVFIADCIAKGLKIVFFPFYIVSHPSISSVGQLPLYDYIRASISAAVDARINPFYAIPKAIIRTVKYTPVILRNLANPFTFLFSGLSAILYVFFTKNSSR